MRTGDSFKLRHILVVFGNAPGTREDHTRWILSLEMTAAEDISLEEPIELLRDLLFCFSGMGCDLLQGYDPVLVVIENNAVLSGRNDPGAAQESPVQDENTHDQKTDGQRYPAVRSELFIIEAQNKCYSEENGQKCPYDQ